MKIRLYLEICSACNLKCQYCFEKEYAAKFINAEALVKFTDTIRPLINDIVITGGEPTLHTEFYELVYKLRDKFCRKNKCNVIK